MLNTKILLPAYGRTYPNASAMVADWENGKDFRFPGGPYCSIRDLTLIKKNADCIVLSDAVTGAHAIAWHCGELL